MSHGNFLRAFKEFGVVGTFWKLYQQRTLKFGTLIGESPSRHAVRGRCGIVLLVHEPCSLAGLRRRGFTGEQVL